MAKKLSVELKVNSQDITNNKSNVTVKVYITTSGNAYMNNKHSGKLTFNGKSYTFSGNAPKNKKHKLCEETLNITHSQDGTRTVKASATFEWVGTTKETLSASKSLVLPPFSAAATLSSVSKATTGGNCVVKFTSQTSQNYQLKFTGGTGANAVTVTYPAASTYLAGNSTTATDGVSVPMSVDPWNKIMPDSATGQVTCELITYNEEKTKIGNSSKKTFTLTANSDCKPTAPTATLECVDGLDATHYLKGKSRVEITPSSNMAGGEPSGGATISYYVISIDNMTYPNLTAGNENALTSNILQTTGQINISITAYDTRGRNATTDNITIDVYDYLPPTVAIEKLYRCNSNGIADNKAGVCGYIKWSVTLSNIGEQNNNTITKTELRYKRADLIDGDWIQTIEIPSSANYSYIFGGTDSSDPNYENFKADSDYSYIVQIIVTDRNGMTSAPINYYLPSGRVLIDFNESGRAIAFGTFSTKNDEDAFECGLNTYFKTSVVKVKNSDNSGYSDVVTGYNIGDIFDNLPAATINQIKLKLGIN